MFLWVGALAIASLISFICLYQLNQPAVYFLMPARFWEMAAGCLIFIGFQKRAKIEQALERVPPLGVVAAMLGVMFLPTEAAVPATIFIVLLSSILVACLKEGTAAYNFFTLDKVVYLGLISYSLYLWHWSVLSLSRWTIGIHWWSVPIQVGLMLVLAMGSYQWIEAPIRQWNRLKHGNKSFLAFGLMLPLIGTAALAIALTKSEMGSHLFVGDRRLSDQLGKLGSTEQTHYKKSAWSAKKCAFTDKKVIDMNLSIDDCYLKYDLKVGNAGKKALVIGNSFSVAQMRMYESLSAEGYSVYLTSGWGCPIVKTLKEQNVWRESCEFYNETFVPSLLKYLAAGDVLLMISDVSLFATENNSQLGGFDQGEDDIFINGKKSSLEDRLVEARRELQSIIEQMKKRGVRVVFQDMTPLTRKHPEPFMCVNMFGIKAQSRCVFYDRSRHESARARFSELLRALQAEHSNFYILDLFGILCPKPRCDYTDNAGNLLYRDVAHLSDFGALQAGKLLKRLLVANDK